MTIDAHARPSGDSSEPLYDVNVPTPTHAERARTLVAGIATGTLCTIAVEPAGYPYGSFVTVAFDGGNPVFRIGARGGGRFRRPAGERPRHHAW